MVGQAGTLAGVSPRSATHPSATDPIWSLKIYKLEKSVTKPNEPVLYYCMMDPNAGFVCEELLVVSPDTQLPPDSVFSRSS